MNYEYFILMSIVLFLNDDGPGVLVKSDNFREKWEN